MSSKTSQHTPDMQTQQRHQAFPWKNYSLLALAIIVYLGLQYFAPTPSSNGSIHLTTTQLNLLKLTVIVPYICTWILAVYSFTVLGKFTKSNTGGNSFVPMLGAIKTGLGWIVASIIAAPLISGVQAFLPSLRPELTIVTNYLYIFPLLIGFWMMFQGLRRIAPKQAATSWKQGDAVVRALIVSILALFYVFLVFTNPSRQFGHDTITATYYLPDFLVISTIIIPVIVEWWFGFSVAFTISDFIPRVNHPDAYKALTRILYGIWSIIFFSISLQALLSLGTSRLLSVGIGGLLGIVYALLLVQGMSYLLLAIGIRKLQKIAL